MIYLKLLGAILVMISSSLMGVLLSEELQKKIIYYQDFRNLLLYIRSGIEYHRKIIPEILLDASDAMNNLAGQFAKNVGEKLLEGNERFEDLWKQEILNIYGNSEVKKVLNLFIEPGKSLGEMDSKLRIRGIDSGILMLEQQIQQEQLQLLEKCRQKRTLGVLFGLFITIIFI